MPTSALPTFTVRVPSSVLDACEQLGYGIGNGPAGGGGGVRQTSGIAPMVLLAAFLAETSRPLANTFLLKVHPPMLNRHTAPPTPRVRRYRCQRGSVSVGREHSHVAQRAEPAPAGRAELRHRSLLSTRSGATPPAPLRE